MRTLLLAGALAGLSAIIPTAQAQAEELSLADNRLIDYGTMAVAVGICKPTMTAEQTAKMNAGLKAASEAPHNITQAQFTEAMKAFGAKIGENREQSCAAFTPEVIDSVLEDSAAGK